MLFFVTQVKISRVSQEKKKQTQSQISKSVITLTIKNIGYASLKQNFCLVISCGDKDFTSDVIRGLEPGQSVNVRFDKKAVTNGGTLFIKRLNDNKRIQIFNEPI